MRYQDIIKLISRDKMGIEFSHHHLLKKPMFTHYQEVNVMKFLHLTIKYPKHLHLMPTFIRNQLKFNQTISVLLLYEESQGLLACL